MWRAASRRPAAGAAIAQEISDRLRDLLGDAEAGSIEVPGDAPVARKLRDKLGSAATDERTKRPTAVVDTSGSPALLREALNRLDTEGVLVMASDKVVPNTDLNTYADLHRRSLTVVAVRRSPGGVRRLYAWGIAALVVIATSLGLWASPLTAPHPTGSLWSSLLR